MLFRSQDQDGMSIGIMRAKSVPGDLANLHPSEKEIPDLISRANVVCRNETTIEEFQAKVRDEAVRFLAK